MWTVAQHRQLAKILTKLPNAVLERYLKWVDVVEQSGPQGLRLIKGFRDESLRGEWKGFRSSRLGQQYRVIYQVQKDEVLVFVIDLTAHDYKRK